jgi:hypothetical protein
VAFLGAAARQQQQEEDAAKPPLTAISRAAAKHFGAQVGCQRVVGFQIVSI